jgi:peroxiredoxin
VEVVAISPQTPEKNKAMGLPFPVLSDPDLKVTTDYGLVHPKAIFGKDMPRPATILVNKGDRNIQWLKAADHVRIRPTPEEIIEALRQ